MHTINLTMKTPEKIKKPVGKLKDSPTSRWISYRPEIKVLDCTIRDGGLMNNHLFDDAIVREVYRTCVEAGIDYMEIGYKGPRKAIVPGAGELQANPRARSAQLQVLEKL